MIVVKNASSDATAAVATAHGAMVVHEPQSADTEPLVLRRSGGDPRVINASSNRREMIVFRFWFSYRRRTRLPGTSYRDSCVLRFCRDLARSLDLWFTSLAHERIGVRDERGHKTSLMSIRKVAGSEVAGAALDAPRNNSSKCSAGSRSETPEYHRGRKSLLDISLAPDTEFAKNRPVGFFHRGART